MSEIAFYISDSLKKGRLGKGLSQKELATKSGLSQAQISNVENNTVDSRVSTLITLGRALGLELVLVPRSQLPALEVLLNPERDYSEQRPMYQLGHVDDD